ncbi:MAG: esterase family protein, partial [Blautia sp.]|nr:esterase family protein [Blautia sp.]
KMANTEEGDVRFVTETIPSVYKAIATGSSEDTEEEEFLVYLPKSYDETENAQKLYPVVYLFHQLNSSPHSYVMDHIDQILDKGIEEGTIPEVIVVIPDSAPESWWMGGWDQMVVKEILPYVEEKYRAYGDREHRFTAGASMGGHGSYYIGLSHPDIFGGMISFYGAINMGADPLSMAERMEGEVLSSFKYYFICGNRDLYKFGIPAIQLDRLLREQGIDHFFELGEGAHDSSFYLPYFVDAFGYMLGEGD